jgi:hypothetical protein
MELMMGDILHTDAGAMLPESILQDVELSLAGPLSAFNILTFPIQSELKITGGDMYGLNKIKLHFAHKEMPVSCMIDDMKLTVGSATNFQFFIVARFGVSIKLPSKDEGKSGWNTRLIRLLTAPEIVRHVPDAGTPTAQILAELDEFSIKDLQVENEAAVVRAIAEDEERASDHSLTGFDTAYTPLMFFNNNVILAPTLFRIWWNRKQLGQLDARNLSTYLQSMGWKHVDWASKSDNERLHRNLYIAPADYRISDRPKHEESFLND